MVSESSEGAVSAVATNANNNKVGLLLDNSFAFGSVFAEYNFGDSDKVQQLGVDFILLASADINSKSIIKNR
jgi:hypothetical protein